VAGRIEAIHDRVTALVGYQSPGPIQVVLADPMAESNGMAVPLITVPHVLLWRTEPRSDSELGHFPEDWTEVLLSHELTHIHHLTRPERPPEEDQGTLSLFRLPLGPLLLKTPRWVTEGYATLAEGRISGAGRPHSSLRAAVLRQWARAGKLPPYADLSGDRGYLGGSMAYLVGSAYLEWLERQRPDQPDILQHLWKQLASRRHRSFEEAFAATFGFTAQDGYQRFQAETVHDSLEWESRLKAQGTREGSLWLRVQGGISGLGVSPDGTRLLARLQTRKNPGLRVWDLSPAPPAKTGDADAAQYDRFNGVADAPPEFPQPSLVAALPTLDHQEPRDPRWLDDRTILFQVKRADREGTLRPRPALWRPGHGVEFRPVPAEAADVRVLLPVRRGARWALELDGQAVPLPGEPAGQAWVDGQRRLVYAGCDLEGVWNIVRIPYQTGSGGPVFGPPQVLTRTPSAAWNPAPSPDGRWLYYTGLDARGMEIRKLDLDLPPLVAAPAPEPRIFAPGAAMPPPPPSGALPPPVPAPPSAPYRALDNLWQRPALGINLTPAGNSIQLGVAGSDLLGRLSWQALAGLGNGPGPRGAMLGASSAAWSWKPSAAVFSALERPSLQHTAPAPADRERRGVEGSLAYDHLGDTRWWVGPMAAWERILPLAPATPAVAYDRGLVGLRAGLEALRARDGWGLAAVPAVQACQGTSSAPGGARSWQLLRPALTVRLETPWLPLAFMGEQGLLRGNPQETFALGGVTTSLVPASLDLDRIEQPALPARSAVGDRFQRWRGELGGAVRLYEEGTAVWNAGQGRGPFQRVLGLEFALDSLALEGWPPAGSDQARRRFQVEAGVHRPLDGVMRGRTVATLTLVMRP
jgi:hypothetical protein